MSWIEITNAWTEIDTAWIEIDTSCIEFVTSWIRLSWIEIANAWIEFGMSWIEMGEVSSGDTLSRNVLFGSCLQLVSDVLLSQARSLRVRFE